MFDWIMYAVSFLVMALGMPIFAAINLVVGSLGG